MNVRPGPPPARSHARARRWLLPAMLIVNLAGITAIAWFANNPQHVALGAVPLSMLLVALA